MNGRSSKFALRNWKLSICITLFTVRAAIGGLEVLL
jgi:hypothetical protein